MLWLAVSLVDNNTGEASFVLISLNEFSLDPIDCDSSNENWWLYPGSMR